MGRLLLMLTLCTASAQTAAPTFEVASVKFNRSGPDSGNGFYPLPGRLRIINMTFEQLLQAAYSLKTGTLFGLTPWMTSDRFDIDAKTPDRSTFEASLVMLRALLEDRFQLRFHRETRELKSYVLVLAKNGPKFHATPNQEQKEQIAIRPTAISGTAIPFGHFVTILAAQLKYPIANATGLSGNFDLSFKYARDDSPDPDAPSVFAALEDQLGLKLESRKSPTEAFVIDSAAKPQ